MSWLFGKRRSEADDDDEYDDDDDEEYTDDDEAGEGGGGGDESVSAEEEDEEGDVESASDDDDAEKKKGPPLAKAPVIITIENNKENHDLNQSSTSAPTPVEKEQTTDATSANPAAVEQDNDNQSPPNDSTNNNLTKDQNNNGSSTDTTADNQASPAQVEEEEDNENVTSTQDKRSLLVLAAEHDRVDILKAILADATGDDREVLLNSGITPLHIAIAYGSTNATQCLLRMGADPSVRPDVHAIQRQQLQAQEIPNMARFHQLSVWELAFGKEDNNSNDSHKKDPAPKSNGSWFGGGGNKKNKAIDIPPSKVEGIRHAFTAEALRCIGSDEAPRLAQLVNSGMPSSIDIGGKHLYDWAVEMGALHCEELLRPAEASKHENTDTTNNEGARGSAVLDRFKPDESTVAQLNNRLDELEALAQALSSCLDNLAEEVSVCHGLLLMGGGASALASHVRSLKTWQQQKGTELERMQEAFENSQDELAYWVREAGPMGEEIANAVTSPADLIVSKAMRQFDKQLQQQASPKEEEDEAHVRQQLQAQVAASENKICKLRASIADLSEENTRDLEEVEKRGLSGGIKLVRGLRDELRELDFHLNETKSAEALCRAKIKLIQAKTTSPAASSSAITSSSDSNNNNQDRPTAQQVTDPDPKPSKTEKWKPAGAVSLDQLEEEEREYTPSEQLASGQSSAMALKNEHSHGYFTVDLWQILLRIIGLGSASSSSRIANRPRSPITPTSMSPPSTTIMIV